MNAVKWTIVAIAGAGAATLGAVVALNSGTAGASSASPEAAIEAAEAAATDAVVTVYKSPTCGCCSAWAEHMAEAGFTVEAVDTDELDRIKDEHGVPDELRSCHTAVVDGYVIEGHVPADLVQRFLEQRPPEAVGLAVPGMPIGSPGMEMPGRSADPYQVIAFTDDGRATVYATR